MNLVDGEPEVDLLDSISQEHHAGKKALGEIKSKHEAELAEGARMVARHSKV